MRNLTVLEKNGGCVNENISGSDIDVLNVSNWLSTTDILILDKKSESMYNNISQSIIKKVSKANSVESEKYPELKGEAWSVCGTEVLILSICHIRWNESLST